MYQIISFHCRNSAGKHDYIRRVGQIGIILTAIGLKIGLTIVSDFYIRSTVIFYKGLIILVIFFQK